MLYEGIAASGCREERYFAPNDIIRYMEGTVRYALSMLASILLAGPWVNFSGNGCAYWVEI